MSLELFLLKSKLINVFVFLINFVQLVVSLADLHDLLDAVGLDWVVVDVDFGDRLVLLQCILDPLCRPGLNKIVSKAESLDRREWTLNHLQELLGNMVALNRAL